MSHPGTLRLIEANGSAEALPDMMKGGLVLPSPDEPEGVICGTPRIILNPDDSGVVVSFRWSLNPVYFPTPPEVYDFKGLQQSKWNGLRKSNAFATGS